MNKAHIIQAIYQVLDQHLMIPQIDAFHDDARLNQDLYLDSVLVLELILCLETELGLDIPDDALTQDDFETVSNLADFLMKKSGLITATRDNGPLPQSMQPEQQAQTEQQAQQDTEEFEDIKVHCFVSCVCDIIKPNPDVDHRPFYFGVWDAEIVINAQHQLDYHSDTLNHDRFRHWFKALYSVDVTPWYDQQRSKSENINRLVELVEQAPDHQRVMVMIDMYRLPERENKFNQNPFPHYVMLETTDDPDQWMMLDPDFRWEGRLAKDKILHAIASPAVAGGYLLDNSQIRPSSVSAIRDYFIDSLHPNSNPMTEAVYAVVHHHRTHSTLPLLPDALKQLPVLAIRKYAYEHGLAFFYLNLGYHLDINDDPLSKHHEFEELCAIIEQLVESYKLIQYRAMKLAKTNDTSEQERLLLEIDQIIEQQNAREFTIKRRLSELFTHWCEQQFNDAGSLHTSPSEEVLEA